MGNYSGGIYSVTDSRNNTIIQSLCSYGLSTKVTEQSGVFIKWCLAEYDSSNFVPQICFLANSTSIIIPKEICPILENCLKPINILDPILELPQRVGSVSYCNGNGSLNLGFLISWGVMFLVWFYYVVRLCGLGNNQNPSYTQNPSYLDTGPQNQHQAQNLQETSSIQEPKNILKIASGWFRQIFMDSECSLCKVNYSETAEMKTITLKCGHIFHENCAQTYIRNECPLCRKPIDRSKQNVTETQISVNLQTDTD